MRGLDSRHARIMSTRSAAVNSGVLPGFSSTPTTTLVEDRRGAVEDVEVPERHRVEAAGVHRDALAHAVPSDGAASRCRKLMVVRP